LLGGDDGHSDRRVDALLGKPRGGDDDLILGALGMRKPREDNQECGGDSR
jgi:hypothetical protein